MHRFKENMLKQAHVTKGSDIIDVIKQTVSHEGEV